MSSSLGDEVAFSDKNIPTNASNGPAQTRSQTVDSNAARVSQNAPKDHENNAETSPKSALPSESINNIKSEHKTHKSNSPDSPAPLASLMLQKKGSIITSEAALGFSKHADQNEYSKISAYARLDFENFTFFVQTLQVILGRKSNDELLNGSQHSVDVHLSSKKAISRRHAKIFYNFGTQRFELSILGRNGAFVDDLFVEKGITVPVVDGTKIQIGDIPFSFVLPSIEPRDTKESNITAKPLNPSDAISLRSSLYASGKSGKKNIKVEHKNLKSGLRRLSEARRKSLASATNEEINSLLVELGVNSLEAIDDQDPEFVDSQIRAILGDGHADSSAIIDTDGLSDFMEGEEDELDKLVKTHNLEQGVDLDESLLDKDVHEVDMTIQMLDVEIAALKSSTGHISEDLIRQKEAKRRQLEEERRKLLLAINKQPTQRRAQRSGPLMGKPATPRMGKPASIQPPASRLYGRQVLSSGKGAIDSRLSTASSSMAGLPTHLVPSGPGNHPLKVAQGTYGQMVNKPYNQPRVPAPELLVPIHTIIQKPAPSFSYDRSSITISLAFEDPPVWLPKTDAPTMTPKIPKRKKESTQIKKPYKSTYTINEIPEQYRTKPTLSFPVMIINVLKYKETSDGLSLNEIVEGIKEVYPYYKFCPDGWQPAVSHNVKLNKIFKAIKVDGDVELTKWMLDDEYVQEKEKIRKKQQEIAAQRAKEAASRAEELKQKQRLEMQQSLSQNIMGRDYSSPYSLPLNNRLTQSPLISQLSKGATAINGKPKTIAELASEISRDSSTAPMYFKSQTNGDMASPNIKAQLAANRSQLSPSASSSPGPGAGANASGKAPITADTKKSLAYLQKELFTLYKAKKLSYNTTVTTEIITKALATTIAQVNAIGAKAGIGDNALGFLVEKAPQQVSKILDIALNKSIKERQGASGSKPGSGSGTPGPSTVSSPGKQSPQISRVASPSLVKENTTEESPVLSRPQPGSGPLKPPSFNKTAPGLARPAFFSNKPPTRPGFGGKPDTLARPTFASSTPPVREEDAKRANNDAQDEQNTPNKAPKIEL